jgi:murein DD-endopeptidase MepM/ murein hydrolase activator NlpD
MKTFTSIEKKKRAEVNMRPKIKTKLSANDRSKSGFIFFGALLSCVMSLSAQATTQDCSGIISIEGRWLQGALLTGRFVDASAGDISFLENEVPVSADGVFMLGLGRDAPKTVQLGAVSGSGVTCQQAFTIAQRDYKIQRVEGVPPKTVNPGPEYYKRIRTEAAAARKARTARLDLPYYLQHFQWPVTGRISGVYGSQRYYNGTPRRPHFGVDIARPTGTPVVAPAAGVVTLAHDDMFFSGGTLILDHGQGLSSSFLHLSKLLVEVGQTIEQGQLIAEVGASGRVTGPHLDWRMNWFDQRVDPQLLVPPMP